MTSFQAADLLISGLTLLTIAATAAMMRWPIEK